jgi:NAD(P)H dehydrogenase (quinone)
VFDQVKVAVIYYSSTGTVYELAKSITDGAEKAGAEVRLRKVRELAPDEAIAANAGWASHAAETQHVTEATAQDVIWADAVILGSPTRFGNIASQLKQFIDTLGGPWMQGQLADKVYSGFTATSTAHGGQESTILALYNTVHHFGGIVVAPGYTDPIKFADGNPYGTSHVAGEGDLAITDTTRQAAAYQGARVVNVAADLKFGRDDAHRFIGADSNG